MPDPSPVESIFLAALDRPTPEARAAFLAEACGPDPDLRRRVERLLAAHPRAADFLGHPAAAPYAPTADLPATQDAPGAAGERAGPYKLLQRLGEGGMGEVWVAEQTEPVRRRVALKLVKPGMDSRAVLARFEAERQALAMMDHTNIAKVFDAGTTDAGRPYFVMELVKGVPITTYCDELHLTVRDRLDLFVQVCAAVQHAHQKGVIHRDLKPSNVLVAVQDGKPVPKVIDFGVAKAVHAKLTDRTMYTEIGAVIGTLEYMSPEQAELSALDIDTRADVYALGVLLYELLTGSTPLTRERLKTAAFAEAIRLIKEEEAPRPSTRLTQSREALAGLAAKRRTDPGRLAKELLGDLDWIVLKALEKDRTRRYETTNALSRDVQRYLSDEPVEASPPSAGYRLRKFLRRNRAAAVATAAVVAGALLAAAGQTWNLMQAREAERRALAAERGALAEREEAETARQTAQEQRKAALAAAAAATESGRKAVAAQEQMARAMTRSDGLRFAAESNVARTSDPGRALLLGLEAVRRHPHHLTFSALYDAAADLHEKRTVDVRVPAHFLRLSQDGSRLFVGTDQTPDSDQGTAAVYVAATGKKLSDWHGFRAGLADLDWSRDGARGVGVFGGRVTVAFTDGRQPDRASFTERVAYVFDAVTGRDVAHLRGHLDKVVSARFSPDGTKVVTASLDRTARVWDAATGRDLHVLRGHERPLRLALFSPDGRRVLTVSAQDRSRGPYADDAGNPQPLSIPNPDPGVTDRPYRVEGSASGGGGWGSVSPERTHARLWDADTGRELAALTFDKGITGLLDFTADQPLTATFSPDGSRAALGYANDLIGVWDAAAGGKQLRQLRTFGGQVTTLAFSPDGTRLAAAGDRSAVFLWDPGTGALLRRLEGHERATVYSVRFSKDGHRLVSAAADNTARVWDAGTGRPLAILRGHAAAVRAADFLGDSDTVVTAGDRTVRVWSVRPPAPVPTLLVGIDPEQEPVWLGGDRRGHTSEVWALTFTPDGKTVLTGSQDYTARAWDAASGRHTAVTSERLRGAVRHILFAPDGKTVYLGTELNRVDTRDRGDKDTLLSMVHRWDPATGKSVRFLKGQRTWVTSMTLSPDGRRLLVVGSPSRLTYRPTPTNPLLHGFDYSGPGGEVTLWDTETGQLVAKLPGARGAARGVPPQFTPDGKTLLYAPGRDDQWNSETAVGLALIDAATGDRVRVLTPPQDYHSAEWMTAVLSPDGKTVAAVKNGSRLIWFWDTATGAVLGSYQDAEVTASPVPAALRFSPDSKRLAAAADRFVVVIDVATRTRAGLLRGHEDRVTALAFSPDGARLLTGSDDRTAALWEFGTGRLLAVYKGHPGPVRHVAYSPDGTRVATASTDPVARVWPVDLLPAFERRRPRDFTPAERDRYEMPTR